MRIPGIRGWSSLGFFAVLPVLPLHAGQYPAVDAEEPLPAAAAEISPPAVATPEKATEIVEPDYRQLTAVDLHREATDLIAVGCHPVDFSPDGKRLAVGSALGTVTLYDIADPSHTVACNKHYGMILTVAFSADGQTLLTAACDGHTEPDAGATQAMVIGGGKIDNTIRLWEAATGRELRQLGDGKIHQMTQRTPGGAWILAAAPNGTLSCYSSEGGDRRGILREVDMFRVVAGPGDKTALIRKAPSMPKLQQIPAAGGPCAPPTTVVVQAQTPTQLITLPDCKPLKTLAGLPQWEAQAVFTPDGKRLLVDGPLHAVTLWDLEHNRMLRRVSGHSDKVTCIAVNGDGSQFATGSADRTIRLESMDANRKSVILKGHTDTVCQVEYLPDGKHLLSVGGDNTVRIWSLASSVEVFRLTFPAPQAYLKVSVSRDGLALAVQVNHDLKLYRVPVPKPGSR